MITYNVTVSVEATTAEAWQAWMRDEHIAQILDTGCFRTARLYRLLDVEGSEGYETFVAQYDAPDRAHYERYIAEHAQEMRRRGMEKFGDRFTAFRTIMEQIA